MLPVDEPDGKDGGEELAMEVDEEALATKFPVKECVVELEDFEWLCKASKIWGNELPKTCEKARVRSCCERVKVETVVTGTAGVSGFIPDEGGAEDEAWSESNMAATLLFVEHPGIRDIWNAQQKKRSQKNSQLKNRKTT